MENVPVVCELTVVLVTFVFVCGWAVVFVFVVDEHAAPRTIKPTAMITAYGRCFIEIVYVSLGASSIDVSPPARAYLVTRADQR